MATSIFTRQQTYKSFWSLFIFWSLVTKTLAATINYCSSENTGSAVSPVYNQFQSNGACHDTCTGKYAIAIIAGSQCWCSNYAPATTVSITNCQVQCPGYMEWCGNAAQGYYAYFLLDGKVASGTAGASSTSSSVSTAPRYSGSSTSRSSTSAYAPTSGSSSLTIPTAQQSTTSSSSTTASSPTLAATTQDPTTSSTDSGRSSTSDSTSSASSSSAPTQILTSVTTVTGQVRTILITPTSTPDSSLGSTGSSGGGGGVGTGAVVGIVIGVALGIGLVIGGIVWYFLRRRHRRAMDAPSIDGPSVNDANNGTPSRQVSQMSSAGLLGRGPRIVTSGIAPSSGPKSASSNRHSLGTDQRLNPYAIYAQEESRHSNVSLQDNQDYSRQLRVANPDL